MPQDRETHLSLHVCNLVQRESILVERNFCNLQEPQEAQLAWQQEQKTLSALSSSCGTTDSVNVVSRVIRRVELDDPVDLGDIETSCRNVRTQQNTLFGIAELKEGICTLLLLLLALHDAVLASMYRNSRR